MANMTYADAVKQRIIKPSSILLNGNQDNISISGHTY
jgi:hypothetical protein